MSGHDQPAAHTERVTLPANRLRPGDLIEGVPVVSTSREFPQNDLSWLWIHLDDGTSLHRLETCEVEVDVRSITPARSASSTERLRNDR